MTTMAKDNLTAVLHGIDDLRMVNLILKNKSLPVYSLLF